MDFDFDKKWERLTAELNKQLKERGWSIQEFADYANKDRASVNKIVSGPQKDMRLSTLFLYAETLGVKVSDLLKNIDE